MINYDKLEKAGEYKDGSLVWFTDKEENVVYLLRIGEDYYIGSTKNLRRRFSQYLADLNNGIYCSPVIQKYFNEIGQFEIFVLDRVSNSKLREREQFFIDLIEPNLNIVAASNGNTSLPLLEKIANVLEVDVSELFAPSTHEDGVIHCPNCGAKLELKQKED